MEEWYLEVCYDDFNDYPLEVCYDDFNDYPYEWWK